MSYCCSLSDEFLFCGSIWNSDMKVIRNFWWCREWKIWRWMQRLPCLDHATNWLTTSVFADILINVVNCSNECQVMILLTEYFFISGFENWCSAAELPPVHESEAFSLVPTKTIIALNSPRLVRSKNNPHRQSWIWSSHTGVRPVNWTRSTTAMGAYSEDWSWHHYR